MMRTAKETRSFNYRFASTEIEYAENEIEKAAKNGEFSVSFDIIVSKKANRDDLEKISRCVTSSLYEAGYSAISAIDEFTPRIHYTVKWEVLPKSTLSEMKGDNTL